MLPLDSSDLPCVPENMPLDGISLAAKCICHINVSDIVAALVYTVEVKSNGKSLKNSTARLSQKVKPRAPTNVTVDLSELDTVIIWWDPGYSEENYLYNMLFFSIQITCKSDPTQVRNITLKQIEAYYTMNKRQLNRRYDYMVKVRSKANKGYNGVWSDWSSAAEWHNDKQDKKFKVDAYDIVNANISSGVKPPSTYYPQADKEHYIQTFYELVLRDLRILCNNLEKTKGCGTNNLNHKELEAINSLKNNNDLVIKVADKGGGIIILNKEDYLKEALNILGNVEYYQ
ncbi:interleukin-4 receptor subunit alpha isoform X1, partial [Pelobates cultripes]